MHQNQKVRGVLNAPPVGSGAEPQLLAILVHFRSSLPMSSKIIFWNIGVENKTAIWVHWFYRVSKKHNIIFIWLYPSFQGEFIGLKNLGATCYVNTFLQVCCYKLYIWTEHICSLCVNRFFGIHPFIHSSSSVSLYILPRKASMENLKFSQ